MMDTEKTYTVRKSVLLEKLRENRTQHVVVYKDALIKYRKKAGERLTSTLKKIESGRKFTLAFADIPKPVSYEKEYDKVIGLLEMSVEDETEITSNEYSCYVLDDWTWKNHFFMNSTHIYGAVGATGPAGPTGASGPAGSDNDSEESDDE